MTKKNKNTLPVDSIDRKIADYLIVTGMKMLEIAKDRMSKKKCEECGKKDTLKAVPLYNDPYPLPTEIVAYCSGCKHGETLIIRDLDSRTRSRMRKVQRMVESANKIINKK